MWDIFGGLCLFFIGLPLAVSAITIILPYAAATILTPLFMICGIPYVIFKMLVDPQYRRKYLT